MSVEFDLRTRIIFKENNLNISHRFVRFLPASEVAFVADGCTKLDVKNRIRAGMPVFHNITLTFGTDLVPGGHLDWLIKNDPLELDKIIDILEFSCEVEEGVLSPKQVQLVSYAVQFFREANKVNNL